MFPVLLYGLECCQLNKADLQSLDFSSNRLLMKLFRTGSIDVVQECRSYFGIELPSCLIKKRQDKFLSRFNSVDNVFCRYCCKLWFFVLLCSELFFSLSVSTCIVYYWCLWRKLIISYLYGYVVHITRHVSTDPGENVHLSILVPS